MLGLWQHCQEGGDQGSEFLASHSTPVETALKFAVSDELFSKGTNPLPLPRPKHPYWDTGLRNDPTPPPKYYGWHSLLTFLQRSRATPSTRHTPLSAVSTRGPNLLGHPHLPAAFCPSESHSISFACLWFQILHCTLWNSWFAISKLLCRSPLSEYLLPLLPLTETWLSLSNGTGLFSHPSFASGPVGRVGLGFHISEIW